MWESYSVGWRDFKFWSWAMWPVLIYFQLKSTNTYWDLLSVSYHFERCDFLFIFKRKLEIFSNFNKVERQPWKTILHSFVAKLDRHGSLTLSVWSPAFYENTFKCRGINYLKASFMLEINVYVNVFKQDGLR